MFAYLQSNGKVGRLSTTVAGTFSEIRCLCDVFEEAVCFDQVKLGASACLEVAA